MITDCPSFHPPAVSTNGQSLKRKGLKTRQRLMDAALTLLRTCSPVQITAVAIAREAGTASTTFYVYFEDVPSILYAISEAATAEMITEVTATTLFDDPALISSDSVAFVEMFNRIWDRHSAIFLYRNMESDRGNPRFSAMREAAATVVLDRLYRLFRDARPKGSELLAADAYAEAVVIMTAIERLAAVTHTHKHKVLEPARLRAAQARILIRMLEPVPA